MNSDVPAAQPNAITGTVTFLQQVLVGSPATSIAIIAVAGFGLTLLTGRISGRRGVQLVLGCFIIFGASGIAQGIAGILVDSFKGKDEPPPTAPAIASSPLATPPPRPVAPYDPYAGAALPPRR